MNCKNSSHIERVQVMSFFRHKLNILAQKNKIYPSLTLIFASYVEVCKWCVFFFFQIRVRCQQKQTCFTLKKKLWTLFFLITNLQEEKKISL